jgi:hypothetical protein
VYTILYFFLISLRRGGRNPIYIIVFANPGDLATDTRPHWHFIGYDSIRTTTYRSPVHSPFSSLSLSNICKDQVPYNLTHLILWHVPISDPYIRKIRTAVINTSILSSRFGLTDLLGDGTDGIHPRNSGVGGIAKPSGPGLELTFRVIREETEEVPPSWPAAFMQSFAGGVFQLRECSFMNCTVSQAYFALNETLHKVQNF